MRELRLILEGEVALYAISNEVALDLPDLSTEEQQELSRQMAIAAEFCGVEVLCWHVTYRGYGALVRVSPGDPVAGAELVRRIGLWYGEDAVTELAAAEGGAPQKFATLCAGYQRKMHSILEYARMFQRRFSLGFNRQHDRRGPVWRQRFRSYLLEDVPEVRIRFAGYIHTRPYGDPDMGEYSSLFQADSGVAASRKMYGALTGKRGWPATRDCLGEALSEMSNRNVRPPCGTMDPRKIQGARNRSRARQAKSLFSDAAWGGHFEAYQVFVKNNGTHRFPPNSPEYDALKYWVRLQRLYLKRGRIGSQRRERLESIAFPLYVNTRAETP